MSKIFATERPQLGIGPTTGTGPTTLAVLQAATDDALATDRVLFLRAGNYDIDDTWTVKGTVIVEAGAVIRPILLWNPLLPNGQFRPYVSIASDDVVIQGLLEIDARALLRTSANTSVGMLINQTSKGVDIEHLRFTDQGCSLILSPGAGPSGPDLMLTALDVLADNYAGAVGPCEGVHIGLTEHRKSSDDIAQWFAIRANTDISGARPPANFVNHLRNCRIDRIDIDGEYSWNAVECAGGGSVHNSFGEVYQNGKSLSTMNFDKGCSDNHCELVSVRNGGKPTIFAAYDIQSVSTGVGVDTLTDVVQVMGINQYAGFYLLDSALDLWPIVSNTVDTFTLNAGGAVPAAGAYKVAWLFTFTTRFAAGSCYGIANYLTTGCYINQIQLRDCTSVTDDQYEAVFATQYATDCHCYGIDAVNFNAGVLGLFVHFAEESRQCSAQKLRGSNVYAVCATDANALIYAGLLLADVQVDITGRALVFIAAGAPAAQTGLQVRDAIINVAGPGVTLVEVTDDWSEAVFDNVQVRALTAGDEVFDLDWANGKLMNCRALGGAVGFRFRPGSTTYEGGNFSNSVIPYINDGTLSYGGIPEVATGFFNNGREVQIDVVTPAALAAGETLLWSPTPARHIRFAGAGTNSFVQSMAAGFPGEVRTLENVGTVPVTFGSEETAAAAVDRFAGPDNLPFIMWPGAVADVWYDPTSTRWRPFALNQFAAGGVLMPPSTLAFLAQTATAPTWMTLGDDKIGEIRDRVANANLTTVAGAPVYDYSKSGYRGLFSPTFADGWTADVNDIAAGSAIFGQWLSTDVTDAGTRMFMGRYSATRYYLMNILSNGAGNLFNVQMLGSIGGVTSVSAAAKACADGVVRLPMFQADRVLDLLNLRVCGRGEVAAVGSASIAGTGTYTGGVGPLFNLGALVGIQASAFFLGGGFGIIGAAGAGATKLLDLSHRLGAE